MTRRKLTTVFVVFAASATLPACSLLFDGSGYRADGGPTDGGMGGCTQASCGENYQYCDMMSGMCLAGCNDNADCRNGPTDAGGAALACDPGTHACEPATECDMDMDCNSLMDPGNFCDVTDRVCRPCDGDGDGFAPVGGESCVNRLLTVIGPNDCNDGDPDMRPFLMPDGDPMTQESCSITVSADEELTVPGSLNVFEVGVTALASADVSTDAMRRVLPDSLQVHVLSSGPASVGLMVLYQLDDAAHSPRKLVFGLGRMPPTTAPTPIELEDWAGGAGMSFTSSGLSSSSVGGGMVVVTTVDTEGAAYRQFTRVYDPTGNPMGGPLMRAIAGADPAAPVDGHVVVPVGDGTARSLSAIGGRFLIPHGAATPEVDDRPGPAGASITGAIAGRSYGALRSGGSLLVWNGNVLDQFWAQPVDPMGGSGRPAFASSPRPRLASAPIRTMAARGGGMTLSLIDGSCTGDLATMDCVNSGPRTYAVPYSFPSEPFLTLDHVADDLFVLSGLIGSGPDSGILIEVIGPATAADTGALTIPFPAPVRAALAGAADADIGALVAPEGANRRLTVGFAIAVGNQIRVAALQAVARP